MVSVEVGRTGASHTDSRVSVRQEANDALGKVARVVHDEHFAAILHLERTALRPKK